MNILVLNYEFPPLGGGGGVACEQIAVELVTLGHSVHVITSLGPDTKPHETHRGVTVTRVPVWGRRRRQTASLVSMLTFVESAAAAGRWMVKESRYDLVHVHFAVPTGPAGVRVARAGGLPMVLSLHGGDLYDPSKWMSPHRFWPAGVVVRRVLRAADLVIAQSSNTAENARRYHGFKGHIEIVPLGLAPVEVSAVPREQLGLEPDQFVLVTVGRLVRRKGLPHLLDALAALGDARLRLIICGDGPERANLEKRAAELGLGGRVRFEGHVTEERKFQFLASADLFVAASLHEGFGIIFLEAMSQGLPIVCTNVGGQTDFLEHGRNALLVPPADAEALRAAIRRVVNDAALRRMLAENNRRAVADFDLTRIAARHAELFEKLVAARHKPRFPASTKEA